MIRCDVRYSVGLFRTAYRRAVADILSFWTPEMQEETARHNTAWAVGALDFSEYLYASEKRYEICCSSIFARGDVNTICDVGGFFGAFPLALRRMGFEVAMTEAVEYYSTSFEPLFAFLADQGVRIINFDPFRPDSIAPGQFDVLTAMAILEHYPHSPRTFMQNLRSMAHEETMVYIEVPNIAYFPKRVSMFFGKSPLVSIGDKYKSEVPFIGHHHEYSGKDLEDLILISNMELIDISYYNYSLRGGVLRRLIFNPLLTLSSFLPATREVIAAVARFRPISEQ